MVAIRVGREKLDHDRCGALPEDQVCLFFGGLGEYRVDDHLVVDADPNRVGCGHAEFVTAGDWRHEDSSPFDREVGLLHAIREFPGGEVDDRIDSSLLALEN